MLGQRLARVGGQSPCCRVCACCPPPALNVHCGGMRFSGTACEHARFEQRCPPIALRVACSVRSSSAIKQTRQPKQSCRISLSKPLYYAELASIPEGHTDTGQAAAPFGILCVALSVGSSFTSRRMNYAPPKTHYRAKLRNFSRKTRGKQAAKRLASSSHQACNQFQSSLSYTPSPPLH